MQKKHDLIRNTVALENTASENIAFESRSIFLALEKIALEKETFVTSFGYMSIVIESGERGILIEYY